MLEQSLQVEIKIEFDANSKGCSSLEMFSFYKCFCCLIIHWDASFKIKYTKQLSQVH